MNLPSSPQHPFKSKHFIHSFGYACRGIFAVFQTERNFKAHILVAIVVIAGGFYYRVSWLEWCLLIICITLMMVVEALNTAIEYLVDSWFDGVYDLKAKAVKDIAAGACLLTAIGTAFVGALILAHHLFGF
jgi:undecaprenol kinase